MRHYYSPSQGSLHIEAIDGPREIDAPQSAREIRAGKRPKRVPNPVCTLPKDAREITPKQHAALVDAQAEGMQIVIRGDSVKAVDPVMDPDIRKATLKIERGQKLAASDWTQLPDAPLDADTKQAWADYRQTLRDHVFDANAALPEAPAPRAAMKGGQS